jgi:LCP family protein required for cell wall assembly
MGSALPPGEPDTGPGTPVTPQPTAPGHASPRAGPAAAVPAAAAAPGITPAAAPGNARRRRRRRRILAWGTASLAALLIAVTASGYALLRHFNGNIQQDNISGLLGGQPVNLHPQAENILLIGSDTRYGQGRGYGTGLVTDQSDTLMIVHIPANRRWAEVMSIPRDSWVNIPSCTMGNGKMSAPTQFKINEAFAIGNLYGNHTALGVACTVKTIELNTGIYISHFVVVNFTGFMDMVAALNGVPECNPVPINDPLSHLHLAAGRHMLTPAQALGYVRARYTLGDGSDLDRIGRQQAFMSSLIGRVRSELLNPLAVYRFLDAATRSLTIDSQLGGITGLYDLGESLRDLPPDKIAFFTIPNFPRGEVVPGDTANVLWTQPEDNEIFASFRDDVPASSSLFSAQPARAGSVPAGLSAGAAHGAAGTPGSTASPGSPASAAAPGAAAPGAAASPGGTPVRLQARTASQSICAG